MKDLYLKDTADLNSFINDELADVMQQELILIEFGFSADERIKSEFISLVNEKTDSFCIKIDFDQEDLRGAIEILVRQGVKSICLKQKLGPRKDKTHPIQVLREKCPIERSETAFNFENIQNLFQNKISFFSEIQLNNENLQELFPTLSYLHDKGIKWTLLNPDNLLFSSGAKFISDAFEQLRMRNKKNMNIYFSPSHPHAKHWNVRTNNLFRGPRIVDIDVANTCTHNCVFCGLYSDKTLERYRKEFDNKLPEALTKTMAAKIDRDDCLNIIATLPEIVEQVQFGGLGDPFTSKNIIEFIKACRNRNFNVSCLTNFTYMNNTILDELHSLCGFHHESVHFVVNLSASNSQSYVLNRPNQKERTFNKIVSDLKYTQQLRERDGKGISFTLMSVTHKLNFSNMPELVALAKDVGAMRLWIKPIEIHGNETIEYLIAEQDQFEYARHAKLTLFLAKKLNVNIFYAEILEKLVEKFQIQLSEYEKKISINEQLSILCDSSALLKHYICQATTVINKKTDTTRNLKSFFRPVSTDNDVKPKIISRKSKFSGSSHADEIRLGVNNAGSANDFFEYLPCKIGNEYLRIEVTGSVLPCCISNLPLNSIKDNSISDIWFSDSLNSFRSKLDKINTEKFHKSDPEWLFCQQCPHLHINSEYNELSGIKLEPI